MNEKARKNLFSLIESTFSKIGPESCLDPESEKYPFEDDLKMDKSFFHNGYQLYDLVLRKMKLYEGDKSFGYSVFNEICRNLFQRIKQKNLTIKTVLKDYLVPEDLNFALENLEKILKKSKGRFRLILVTNLLELKGIETCEIGNILIRQVDEKSIISLPEKIDKNASVLGFILDRRSYLNKQDFLKEHKGNTLLETVVEGYHLGDEQSLVFENGLQNIRNLFSYLFLCEHFFQFNKKEFPVETRELRSEPLWSPIEPIGLQTYYLQKIDDNSILRNINIQFARIFLTNRIFIISADFFGQMKERYCLEQFNKTSKEGNKNGINEKIYRSIDWFLKAMLEKDLTDRTIDLFVSLEALLSTKLDVLTSHTDELAENIAILVSNNPEERYLIKKQFKKDIYPLRNKVLHYGEKVSDSNLVSVYRLKSFVVWGIRGILKRLEEIKKYGTGIDAIREYFDRKKLAQP